MEKLRDVAIGVSVAVVVGVALCLAGYTLIHRLSDDEMKGEASKLVDEAKQKDAEFKSAYSAEADAHEKEILRVKRSLERSAARKERMRIARTRILADMRISPVRYILVVVLILSIIGGLIGVNYINFNTQPVYAEGQAGGEYTMVINGYEWGPGVDKLILKLDGKVKASSLEKATFDVAVSYQGWMGASNGKRDVKAMYLCDKDGNKVSASKSEYVALEMDVHPDQQATNPFYYDFMSGVNTWGSPYSYTVTLASGSELVVDGKIYTSLKITEMAQRVSPDADVFNMYTKEFEGITLSYAAYEPKDLERDGEKNALIIWLHGAGEGGTDPYITILGNEVTELAKEEVQKHFNGKGAYVLAPQSPTMWMNSGDGEYTESGHSMYTESLMALIKAYVAEHSDIDTSRIIIGGCSNGGYMTMNMIMTYPDYFAAAYPVCEAYRDEWITDAKLAGIKDMPIWFTHAVADPTVAIADYTDATYARLIDMGASNVHYSRFSDVSGKLADGSNYTYNGHWSWIYTLNNECRLDFNGAPVTIGSEEVTIWQWLAAQSK